MYTVTLARKPLSREAPSVVANVLKHGCGSLHVDTTRIGSSDLVQCQKANDTANFTTKGAAGPRPREYSTAGRWPANLILAHREATADLNDQSLAGGMHSAGGKRDKVVTSHYEATSFDMSGARQMNRFGDAGGASRFFKQVDKCTR